MLVKWKTKWKKQDKVLHSNTCPLPVNAMTNEIIIIDRTRKLETRENALNPKGDLDLEDTGLAVVHCTSSCHNDQLCHFILKSLNVQQL